MNRFLGVLTLFLAVLTVPAARTLGAEMPSADSARPEAAISAILHRFDHCKVVALGMSHWQKDEADLAAALVQAPGFPGKVRNIVIEDGNALYQDRLDRYIAGGDVPLSELQAVWRNTTQPGRGDAPQHRQLLEEVRRLNRELPLARRIRVLAGDPPIDWDRVRTPADLAPFVSVRDRHFASVVLDQVLAKGQTALLLIGAGHVLRHSPTYAGVATEETPTVTNLVESRYPGSMYVVIPYEDFGGRTKELEARLGDWPKPGLCNLRGSWVGAIDASLIYTGKMLRVGMDPTHPAAAYPGLKLQDLADGFLYVGPIASIQRVTGQPERNTPYAAELERRNHLMDELPPPDSTSARPGGIMRVVPHSGT